MPVIYDDASAPQSLGDLQRAIGDGFDTTAAMLDQEHDASGKHTKPLSELTVSGASNLNGEVVTTGARRWTRDAEYGVTLTATTNDLAKADGRAITEPIILLDAAANRTLTGLLPSDDTQYDHKFVVNGSLYTITLTHNDSGSAAGSRFSCPADTDFSVGSGRVFELIYTPSTSVWRVIGAGNPVTQSGTISLTGSDTTNTATLSTAVNTSTAQLRHLGTSSANAGGGPAVRIALTNSTTVTATRVDTSTDVTVAFEVTG